MTREKFWEIVTTKLVWADYWNGESEPSDEIKEILTNSLLIPKPKFKVGDVVKHGPYALEVKDRFYDIDTNEYKYGSFEYRYGSGSYVWNIFPESELELVEAAE